VAQDAGGPSEDIGKKRRHFFNIQEPTMLRLFENQISFPFIQRKRLHRTPRFESGDNDRSSRPRSPRWSKAGSPDSFLTSVRRPCMNRDPSDPALQFIEEIEERVPSTSKSTKRHQRNWAAAALLTKMLGGPIWRKTLGVETIIGRTASSKRPISFRSEPRSRHNALSWPSGRVLRL